MSVSSVLKHKGRTVHTTSPEQMLLDAIVELNKKRIGALVVVDAGQKVVGIVSERDILRSLMERDGALGDMRVSDIMTHRDKLVTASVRDSAETIMEKMTRNRVRHVPVLDGESLVGIVSIGDMVLNRLDAMQVENESMRNYIAHS